MRTDRFTVTALAGATGLLLFVSQACAPLDYYNQDADLRLQQQQQQDRAAMQQRMQTMNQDSERISREIAAVRADLYAFQQSHRKLYEAIDELRQENHARGQEIERLRGLVASLESRANTSDTKWRSDMTEFERKLAQEHQKSINRLTTNLAEEMERSVSQMKQAAAAAAAASQKSAIQGEYTIKAGDTLLAIAQAFGVTVQAIKDANGLKSDVILVGQKLKIPAAR
ncbi:MAG: LysM peptidoglycan-binding domain-containing protein [Lentisphaeria bacterium]|nr:LysM peptidoglycan-binding domain-containing protein [Lentisphaeria bacterium]